MVNTLFRPYDNKCDVWSTGITAIELAETKPPLFGVDPTRAMVEIPRSPPPTLTNPSEWSANFADFLAKCLTKDPNQRPSCTELLQHPFVADVPESATQQLRDLVRQTHKLEEDFQAKNRNIAAAASGGLAPEPSVTSPGRDGVCPPPIQATLRVRAMWFWWSVPGGGWG